MSAITSRSRGGLGLGWAVLGIGAAVMILGGVAATPVAEMSADSTTIARVARITDADSLEVGEPMAAEPVGENSIGPRADQTYNIPGLGDVLAGQHAEDRHGVEALQARLAIQSGGYNRYDCKDGRVRIVKQIARAAFAIVIVESGTEVSAFISERTTQAITRLLERDGCLPPGNPFGGGLATAN
ncbi:MAG: hypothetical protein BPHS0_37 [Phage 5P_3]|nr:MAG: hypothetical protein BPHS0_37 [Phage 5P_3]